MDQYKIVWTFVILVLKLDLTTSLFFDDEGSHVSKIRIHVFQPPPKIKPAKVVKHVHFNIQKPKPIHEELFHPPHEINIPITITPSVYKDSHHAPSVYSEHFPAESPGPGFIFSEDNPNHSPVYSDSPILYSDLHQSPSVYQDQRQSHPQPPSSHTFSQQASVNTKYDLPPSSDPSHGGQIQYDSPQYPDDLQTQFSQQYSSYAHGPPTSHGYADQFGPDGMFDSPLYEDEYFPAPNMGRGLSSRPSGKPSRTRVDYRIPYYESQRGDVIKYPW